MYNMLAGDKLESWGLDMLVYADSHADNAYRGATDAELAQLEQQRQDGNKQKYKPRLGKLVWNGCSCQQCYL